MNEFDRYVAGFPPTKPLLPLFHVCDAVGFKHIIQSCFCVLFVILRRSEAQPKNP